MSRQVSASEDKALCIHGRRAFKLREHAMIVAVGQRRAMEAGRKFLNSMEMLMET